MFERFTHSLCTTPLASVSVSECASLLQHLDYTALLSVIMHQVTADRPHYVV